jgi:hypothetical protein
MRSSKNRKMKFIYTILLFSLCTIIVKPSLGQWMPINKKEIIQLLIDKGLIEKPKGETDGRIPK